MDIRPPKKRPPRPADPAHQLPAITPEPQVRKQPSLPWHRLPPRRTVLLAAAGLVLAIAVLCASLWYGWALGAPSDETRQVRVVIEPGETSASIAVTLYDQGLIRSRLAFNLYTQLSGTRAKLQAGGYVLSPNQDVSTIVEHMTSGKTDEFDITILPGLTLDELRAQFRTDGFSDDEITAAFQADYDHPLLADRPQGASLEGYVYPETYRMNADQPLGALLERSFDELHKTLNEKGYLAEYRKRGLDIHQGLTLASIVQKEVKDPVDQKQVAQVFLSRLSIGMVLGSDVTYMYAAKQLGVEATPGLDSPYNTRKVAGLPPGPIANMNPSALEAVAAPAAGDFLYFVAGDDGKTYYARTEAEHIANVRAHCHTLCQ